MKTIKDVNQAKIDAVENPKKWMKDNEDVIFQGICIRAKWKENM